MGSQIGDSRCIDVVTLPDAIDEADEVFFVVVVAVEEDPPFDIDVARSVIPVTIVGKIFYFYFLSLSLILHQPPHNYTWPPIKISDYYHHLYNYTSTPT